MMNIGAVGLRFSKIESFTISNCETIAVALKTKMAAKQLRGRWQIPCVNPRPRDDSCPQVGKRGIA